MSSRVHPNSTENCTARSPKGPTTQLVARKPTSGTAEQRRSEALLTLRTARAGRVSLLVRGRCGAVV